MIRTRIAPSPTGLMHIGTARTALFNELFARKTGGKFIVRIEDTDRERSKKEYEQIILDGLRWLGLTWDEGPDIGGDFGPYRQSERGAMYRGALEKLLAQDSAYPVEDGEAIRLRVPPEDVVFNDLIRGEVTVNPETWGGDFVIARSLDDPVFHLAVVVDDAAQAISHVIRGEDHLTNTARHILLQRALGLPMPQYAHLPLLLDKSRRKLSKRTGEVNLLAYRDRGFLPEAMLNYLALLGWNPKSDEEFFSHDQLREKFELAGVQKGGAIFDETKLGAFNKHYLRQLTREELLEKARPWLKKAGYIIDDERYWRDALAVEQARAATLEELASGVSFFSPDWPGDYSPSLLVWRDSNEKETKEIIGQLKDFLDELGDNVWTEQTLKDTLMSWVEEKGLKRGNTLWPLRVALTGRENSPGPFETAAVLGKARTLERLDGAFKKITRGV